MSVAFPWISSPHRSLGLALHRYAYCLWELSNANTQTLSGPLTLIRSLWCLEGQMVVVAIRAPGLTPLPIAGWMALGYEELAICIVCVVGYFTTDLCMDINLRYIKSSLIHLNKGKYITYNRAILKEDDLLSIDIMIHEYTISSHLAPNSKRLNIFLTRWQ